MNGLNRELPYLLGKGELHAANKVVQTSYAFTILNIIIILLLFPILFIKYSHSEIHIICISIYLVRLLLTFYNQYVISTLRSNNQFEKLSKIQIYIAFIKLLTSLLILFGFYGFLIAELINIILETMLTHAIRPFKLKPKFHKESFLRLIKVGLPMFVFSNMINFIDSIPKLYLIKYGNLTHMGIFQPILLVIGIVGLLPNSITTYIYPKFTYNLAHNNDVNKIWLNLKKIYLYSFLVISLISIIGYFASDYFENIFPKYASSKEFLKVIMFALPFVTFRMGYMFSTITKSYKSMILFVSLYLFIQLSVLFYLNNQLKNILDIVVYSQVITLPIMFILSIIITSREVKLITILNKNGKVKFD